MKGFTVFLVLAGLALVAANIPVCPVPEDGGDAILFPNLDDCSTFFECDELDPVLLHCPSGLWFNPIESVCDYPENIEEGVCKPPGSGTTSHTLVPEETTAPAEITEGTDSPTTLSSKGSKKNYHN